MDELKEEVKTDIKALQRGVADLRQAQALLSATQNVHSARLTALEARDSTPHVPLHPVRSPYTPLHPLHPLAPPCTPLHPLAPPPDPLQAEREERAVAEELEAELEAELAAEQANAPLSPSDFWLL